MGIYLNPPTCSKEDWLKENADEQAPQFAPAWPTDETILPICLVDNGSFTAAAICYDEREMAAFNTVRDTRRKQWFYAKIDKLIGNSGELKFYREDYPRIDAAFKRVENSNATGNQ